MVLYRPLIVDLQVSGCRAPTGRIYQVDQHARCDKVQYRTNIPKEFFDEIDVRKHHAAAAVSVQSELVHRITVEVSRQFTIQS